MSREVCVFGTGRKKRFQCDAGWLVEEEAAAEPEPVSEELMLFPATSDVLAPYQTAWIPPEAYTKIPAAIRVNNPVSRQYSAKSCPLS